MTRRWQSKDGHWMDYTLSLDGLFRWVSETSTKQNVDPSVKTWEQLEGIFNTLGYSESLDQFKNAQITKQCSCPMIELMRGGCNCGAIQRYKQTY